MKRVFLASIAMLALASPTALAQSNASSSLNTSVSTVTNAVVNNAAGAVVDLDSFSSASGAVPSAAGGGLASSRPELGQSHTGLDFGNSYEVFEFGATSTFGFGCGFASEGGATDCGGSAQ